MTTLGMDSASQFKSTRETVLGATGGHWRRAELRRSSRWGRRGEGGGGRGRRKGKFPLCFLSGFSSSAERNVTHTHFTSSVLFFSPLAYFQSLSL